MNNNENYNNSKKISNKSILYIALMRHKKGLLLVILIAMISSSLAWFYHTLSVGIQVDGEVEDWNVSVGTNSHYDYSFESLYPGVEHKIADNRVRVTNQGGTPAYLSLEVSDIYLYGEKLETNEYEIEKSVSTDADALGKTIYTIKGFPFTVSIYFPTNELAPGDSTSLDFSVVWPFEGDSNPSSKIDEEGNPVPVCLDNIKSPKVLQYVKDQKEFYKEIKIPIIDNPGETIPENNITTCDIIDTYYGEMAKIFAASKPSEPSTETGAEAPAENPTEPSPTEESTSTESGKHPTQDLYIELSLVVTQSGGHNVDVGK